jgi:hypothetical protein
MTNKKQQQQATSEKREDRICGNEGTEASMKGKKTCWCVCLRFLRLEPHLYENDGGGYLYFEALTTDGCVVDKLFYS